MPRKAASPSSAALSPPVPVAAIGSPRAPSSPPVVAGAAPRSEAAAPASPLTGDRRPAFSVRDTADQSDSALPVVTGLAIIAVLVALVVAGFRMRAELRDIDLTR